MSRRFVRVICISLGLVSASCAAQSVFTYHQLETGRWQSSASARSDAARTDLMAVARVICTRARGAVIRITWYSESRDWTAYDTYQAGASPYFERELRFAAFPTLVRIVKTSRTARADIRYINPEGGADSTYIPEAPDIETFSLPNEFPFPLPRCAQLAWAHVR